MSNSFYLLMTGFLSMAELFSIHFFKQALALNKMSKLSGGGVLAVIPNILLF